MYYYYQHIYDIFICGALKLFMVVRPSKTQLNLLVYFISNKTLSNFLSAMPSNRN